MGLMDAVKGVVGGASSGGGILGSVTNLASGLLSKGSEAKQETASNSSAAVGNALNGSGGKVMMAVPVKDVETISKIIATA